MALWFPYLPTERILRGRLGRSWRAGWREPRPPLVVSRHENNAQRIAAVEEDAAGLGLRRGMGLADARAMHPEIEVVEADDAADRQLLESLADWCDRYTPLVALDGADGLFLDIAGCAHLFGGEQAMLEDALKRLSQQGFRARAGLASTPGMAWAAARFLDPVPVAPGEERATLMPLPLAALRLEPAARAGLESVGLRTVGAIVDAPRAPLARRFGAGVILRLDQALGEVEEAVSPRLPVAALSVERHLPEPVVRSEDVERLVFLLAGTLKEDMERRGEGARFLQLSLFRVDGAVRRLGVGASRPLREPALVLKLFRERLSAIGELEADCGFELVRLSALETARIAPEQANLAGGNGADETDLAMFADRVRARLGEGALAIPRPVESHIPERAVALMPYGGLATGAAPRPVPRERPIRLLPQAEPIDVFMAEVPEGPPRQFRWRRVLYRVARAEGPERIAPEWWLGGRQEEPTRDYFRIEDEEGRRYWLYRQGLYDATADMPRWYLHGLFA
ncbi:DNA polymerase Y family protein [Neoaquamicrobium microcysteis]|nr:DNA polymerase Y family protein [Mesorhizobium microcysteis]